MRALGAGRANFCYPDLKDVEHMIDDTIAKIEQRLRDSSSLKEENRTELLKLLASLKSEIGSLSESNKEHAESIAGLAHASTQEAMRKDSNREQLQASLDNLTSSTSSLEA